MIHVSLGRAVATALLFSALSLSSASSTLRAAPQTGANAASGGLAKDVADLNRLVVSFFPTDGSSNRPFSLSEPAWDAILKRVTELKDKYRAGPIHVTGFSIDFSTPPSVTLDFEFK